MSDYTQLEIPTVEDIKETCALHLVDPIEEKSTIIPRPDDFDTLFSEEYNNEKATDISKISLNDDYYYTRLEQATKNKEITRLKRTIARVRDRNRAYARTNRLLRKTQIPYAKDLAEELKELRHQTKQQKHLIKDYKETQAKDRELCKKLGQEQITLEQDNTNLKLKIADLNQTIEQLKNENRIIDVIDMNSTTTILLKNKELENTIAEMKQTEYQMKQKIIDVKSTTSVLNRIIAEKNKRLNETTRALATHQTLCRVQENELNRVNVLNRNNQAEIAILRSNLQNSLKILHELRRI